MQWIKASAYRERKLDLSIPHLCQFKRLPHKRHQLDFDTAAYMLNIHQNSRKLNECIQLTCVSHYFYMCGIVDNKHNDRHLFTNGFVTTWPINIKLVPDTYLLMVL